MKNDESSSWFRAEHVGSLLRSRDLKQAFRDAQSGALSREAFRAIQDRAIREAVALQEEVGLRCVTDGEFRRASYWSHFVEAVEGLEVRESLFHFRDVDGEPTRFTAPHVAAPLRRPRGISTEELRFLRSVTRQTPKITMPSPSTMHFWRGPSGFDRRAYGSAEELFADLGRMYREEIAALAALGATYVQLDEVPLAMLCDSRVREQVVSRGEDPERLADLYVAAINQAIEPRPPGVAAAMHLCRGNYKGKWISEGGYDAIAERLFQTARVDAFLLEYDTPRAGDFAPLRFVPPGRRVVLGLVSTKTPRLEDPEALQRRVDEAARFVPIEQLALSPQCGFASTVAGNPLDVDDERRKLELVVRVAEIVWR